MTIIEDKKVVSVSYQLKVSENGKETLIEETEAGSPFVFLLGTGNLLDAFENNLRGLKPGDEFDFIIDYKSGYGERESDNIAEIPVDAFKDEKGILDLEMIKVGNILPMTDNEGNRLSGIVESIGTEFVKMDFNHPLAEKDLHFTGKVLEVRDATAEEMDHGHVHGEGGHHH